MSQPNVTCNLLLPVRNINSLDSITKALENEGFSVTDVSDSAEITKVLTGILVSPDTRDKDKPEGTNNDGVNRLLRAMSSGVNCVVVVLDDFSSAKICRNDSHGTIIDHSTLSEVEHRHILATLELCEWRYKTAARLLGIDRSTIYRKMKKYGIKKPS